MKLACRNFVPLLIQKKFVPFTKQSGFEFLSNMRYYKLKYEGTIFNAPENFNLQKKLPESPFL